jgi:hypothetical protein
MEYVIAVGSVVLLMVVWALIFRAAKKRPNNGNEMSEDHIPGASGWGQ